MNENNLPASELEKKIGSGPENPDSVPVIQSEKPGIPADNGAFLNGKTVIIAEDDLNSFRYLDILMKGKNVKVIHAVNGLDLLEKVKNQKPDLILLDLDMPVLSGFDFLEEIKPLNLDLTIVVQTAFTMANEKDRCMNSGCKGYIAKPFKKQELFDILKSVLPN